MRPSNFVLSSAAYFQKYKAKRYDFYVFIPCIVLCVQWKISDDGQKKCPKHVEFYSKNKFEKLVYLFGFIIRIYHDARSPERQILFYRFPKF